MNFFLKLLSGLGTILASIFFIFRSGKKQGKIEATQEIKQEIKKQKEKIIKKDEKLKKEIADTKFSDRVKWLQQHAKNRRRSN